MGYWLEAPAAESLGGWARQSFTRANACLVVHGPALPDVDFSVLSQGQFLETPTLTDGRRGTRFFERRQGPVIGLADIPRSTAAATAVGYLQLRLVDRIRGQAGLSYAPFASYSAITGNHALVTYGADAAGQHESVVAQTVLSVLESLIDGGPSEDEQERMAGMLAHAEEMSHGRRAVFEAAGEALAFRCEAIAGDELRRRREAATSQDIQEALLEIRDRSLYSMPQQVELTSPQPVLYRGLSDVVLDGSRHRAVDGGSTLVALERRGMSYIEPNLALTITIDTAQAVLTYGDGTVLLLDDRGAAIILRPRMWRDLPRLRQVALSLVGPNDVIPNGFRYDIPYFTGQGPDRVFDVASHQLQDSRWDDTLPRSRIFVLGGVLLSWLADRELLADWVEVEGRAWLDRYRSGDLGAADLYAHLGGILASDMVNSAGNEVLNRLYFTSGSPKQTALLDKVWSEITPRGSCWIADEPALVDAAHERINTHALPSKVFRRAAPFPVTRRPTARVSSTPSPVGPTPPPPMEVTRHR